MDNILEELVVEHLERTGSFLLEKKVFLALQLLISQLNVSLDFSQSFRCQRVELRFIRRCFQAFLFLFKELICPVLIVVVVEGCEGFL